MTRMMWFVGAVAVVAIAAGNAVSTGTNDQKTRAEVEAQTNIATYDHGDSGINAAKEKGRATLGRFLELVESKTPGNYSFKIGLDDGNGNMEHVWVQLTGLEGDVFKGLIANEPQLATSYKIGQSITANQSDVSDWMIMSDTAIYGGYTMRHALDRLPKEQADRIRPLLRD